MKTIKEIKAELKALALEIRTKRYAFREAQRTMTQSERWEKKIWEPVSESIRFRYQHVAYCLARGRKYEEIEPKVRPGNELDFAKIDKLLAEVAREPETVCADRQQAV